VKSISFASFAAHTIRANPWGITLVFNSPDTPSFDITTPLGVLNKALADSFGGSPGLGGMVDKTLPSDLIRLVIAPKP
jgi:hypothetical protein